MDFYIDVANTESFLLGERDFLDAVITYLRTVDIDCIFKVFASFDQIENLNIEPSSKIKILKVSEVIDSKDIPSKKKTKSKINALARGILELKKPSTYFLSSSSTGMLIQYIRAIFGIQHTAIGGIFPNIHEPVMVGDLGINFTLGEHEVLSILEEFYELISLIQPEKKGKPLKFSLVNIGEESYKGPLFIKRLDRFFSKKKYKNYIYNGFSEGFDLFLSGRDDVFLFDGFTGNIVLKAIEGFQDLLKKQFLLKNYTIDEKLAYLLNFSSLSVGILLAKGLTGRVFLTHGRVNAEEFIQGIKNSLTIINKISNSKTEERYL